MSLLYQHIRNYICFPLNNKLILINLALEACILIVGILFYEIPYLKTLNLASQRTREVKIEKQNPLRCTNFFNNALPYKGERGSGRTSSFDRVFDFSILVLLHVFYRGRVV